MNLFMNHGKNFRKIQGRILGVISGGLPEGFVREIYRRIRGRFYRKQSRGILLRIQKKILILILGGILE